MSSGSGRYQSRLFNFFHQRSRQVIERCDRAFRHLKVTTKWSIEALLYPVYVLFQSMDVGKQISGASPPTLFPVNDEDSQSPPNVDTPIESILQSVTTPTKKPNPISAFKRRNPVTLLPPIRAVASDLATRTVVLVTAENEIHDILTPDQQQAVQEQILLEVARYWHFWRLYTNKNRLSADSTKSLPAADRAIVLLDKIIADIEAVPTTGIATTIQQRSWEIIKVVKTQLNLFLYGIQPADSSASAIAGDDPTTSNLKIPALIWAAVNHFFSGRNQQLSPTRPQFSEVSATQNIPIADPWLSSNDLFGESSATTPSTSQKVIELPEGSKYSFPNLIQWMTSKISGKSSSSELAQRPKSHHFLARIRQVAANLVSFNTGVSSISPVVSQTGAISAPQPQPTDIQHTPDWIETTAQTVGYKRHPLEQLLAWLDRLMLWVEEMFVKIWRSMQYVVRGK